MGRRAVLDLAAIALALAGCAGTAAPDETAPPRTPLPSLRTPTVSVGPTMSPDPSLRPTPDAESAFQQLLASVPEALRGRCERGRVAGVAMARVDCRPANGADAATYLLFDGEAPLTDAYRARVDAVSAADLEGPGCGRGPGAERLPNGRRACFLDDGGATVLWTNDLAYVLASATREDEDWRALDAFWQAAGPITP